MRLLGVSRAELIEQVVQDQWCFKMDNLGIDFSLDCSGVSFSGCEIELRAEEANRAILKAPGKENSCKVSGGNGAEDQGRCLGNKPCQGHSAGPTNPGEA
jgi:hypothetical protein